MKDQIHVTRSSLPSFEEYCKEIAPLWESRWLTNMGEKHKALQRRLEEYLGVERLTLFTNGHLALESVLSVMGFAPGSEIVTTPFTFASTTHAIVRCGFVPVFCDIDPETYTIDAGKIEALITEKTAAILPVHVYGSVCDADRIGQIAQRHGLKVIYDAAHAFGETVDGTGVGSFGDASMFSFHATKVFHTIEGGAVAFRDPALAPLLNDAKNFGVRGPEDVVFAGGNAKMNEFQAAMGLCNLRHIDDWIAERKRVAAHYDARLKGVPGIRLKQDRPGVAPNYAYYPVVFDGFRRSRDEVFERLAEHGVLSRKYFYPLTSDFACYRGLKTAGGEKTPIARHIADRVLTLPMYAELADGDVDRICDLILNGTEVPG